MATQPCRVVRGTPRDLEAGVTPPLAARASDICATVNVAPLFLNSLEETELSDEVGVAVPALETLEDFFLLADLTLGVLSSFFDWSLLSRSFLACGSRLLCDRLYPTLKFFSFRILLHRSRSLGYYLAG